jgi:hypothetical protein
LGSISRKDINIKDIDILVLNEDKNTLIEEMKKKIRINKITNIQDNDFTITRIEANIKDKKVKIEIYACE